MSIGCQSCVVCIDCSKGSSCFLRCQIRVLSFSCPIHLTVWRAVRSAVIAKPPSEPMFTRLKPQRKQFSLHIAFSINTRRVKGKWTDVLLHPLFTLKQQINPFISYFQNICFVFSQKIMFPNVLPQHDNKKLIARVAA